MAHGPSGGLGLAPASWSLLQLGDGGSGALTSRWFLFTSLLP